MNIGIIAPLARPVPPTGHAGIERVIDALANGLLQRGHQITLFASGDSSFAGRLVQTWPEAIKEPTLPEYKAAYTAHLFKIFSKDYGIDLWSNHLEFFPFTVAPLLKQPFVTTCHQGWTEQRLATYKMISETSHLVSISNNQRSLYPGVKFLETIYNGVDTDLFTLGDGSGGYLAWIGWISEKKGAGDAVRIAQDTGAKLKLAGYVAPESQEYFDREIKPYLSDSIEYVGEIDGPEKVEFYQNAKALLSPLHWDEPFGLVPVESMSCGTPVLTTKKGAMPELVEHGKTGWLGTPRELADRVSHVDSLDRATIREHAVKHFSTTHMVDEYERAYSDLLKSAHQ